MNSQRTQRISSTCTSRNSLFLIGDLIISRTAKWQREAKAVVSNLTLNGIRSGRSWRHGAQHHSWVSEFSFRNVFLEVWKLWCVKTFHGKTSPREVCILLSMSWNSYTTRLFRCARGNPLWMFLLKIFIFCNFFKVFHFLTANTASFPPPMICIAHHPSSSGFSKYFPISMPSGPTIFPSPFTPHFDDDVTDTVSEWVRHQGRLTGLLYYMFYLCLG